ncbi:GH14341 [Drosophila grimshawi]|uniref:GH14341 n=1 Tax=Drosophila grimshawi TaxID=7222 RepID=B4JYP9_DROGR|nr:GH14341 [Drosophila grimshawi]
MTVALKSHEEHAARVASVSLGLVLLIVIPSLLLVVCGANYWIRERIAREEAGAAAALLPKRPKLRRREGNEGIVNEMGAE